MIRTARLAIRRNRASGSQRIPFGQIACFAEQQGSFARRGYPAGEVNILPWHPSRNRAATIPARAAPAFLAHPTRFERVTFASRALILAQINPGLAVADLKPIG